MEHATIYGDIRVRYEDRQGSGLLTTTTGQTDVNQTQARGRYKVTLGVKTTSGDWYTDLAMAMGSSGRSDNANFGSTAGTLNAKQGVYVKRAMIGFKATDWLTVEAGRMENPLYTTPMVWDADLTVEGLSEKFKFKANDNLELFGVAGQWAYKGERFYTSATPAAISTPTNEIFAFQGGGKYTLNDRTSAKAALTYSTVSSNNYTSNFKPGRSNAVYTTNYAVNDLDTIEVPAEINYMAMPNVGVRLFGDYVYNTSGSDRFNNAVLASASGDRAAVQAAGNDDTAWMIGVAVGSAKDLKAFEGNKMAKGDWSARIWYQDVGVYSVDQNAVDSDFMDSRVNMKGTVAKAQYNIQDNVALNFAYGHARIKNSALAAAGSSNDLTLNLKDFDLLQFDVTYKF